MKHGMAQVTQIRVSIVVPCYNEEEVLGELHRRCMSAAKAVVGESFELVLIDDGSRDGTPKIIRDLADKCPHTVGVFLARNHGHQKALSAGLKFACGDRIFILDADLQDPPELLKDMMALMDEGHDVVYGQRTTRAGESWAKKVSAALFYRLLNRLTETSLPVDTGDFRLISRRVLDQLNGMPEEDRFIRGMVGWLGYSQVPLPYERQARLAGETKYPLRKMIGLATDAITGFSTTPLRFAIYISLVMALLSLLMMIYVLTQWAAGNTVPGWSSVMTVVLLVSSVQLLTIGILGEYVGRLYMQSKKRPLFVLDEVYRGASRKILENESSAVDTK